MTARMAPPPAVGSQSLRELRRGVAEADDRRVLQVLGLVEGMEQRGQADALLAPVRGRLRAIRPGRRLRLGRLLFLPADPLILDARDWRPQTSFVPRSALAMLAQITLAEIRGEHATTADLAGIELAVGGASTDQTAVVREVGAFLWPRAAAVLRRMGNAELPAYMAAWAAEGLPAGELRPVTFGLSAILAQAQRLHDLVHLGHALEPGDIEDMLAATEPLGARAWGMLLSLLIIRAPDASATFLKDPAVKSVPLAANGGAVAVATDVALAWIEAAVASPSASLSPSGLDELAQQVKVLKLLTIQFVDAGRKRRLIEAQNRLQASCMDRFMTTLSEKVRDKLGALPTEAAAQGAMLDGMEVSARLLRRFALEARVLGGAANYDAALETAGCAVRDANGLSAMDQARLIELLAGPAAALNALNREPRQSGP